MCELTRAGSKARNTIPNGSDILQIPIMEDFDIRDPYRGQLQLRRCHCSCRLTKDKTLLIIIDYWKWAERKFKKRPWARTSIHIPFSIDTYIKYASQYGVYLTSPKAQPCSC